MLEGAKRLSAEHLPPLREAAQRVVSQAAQAAERVPQTAKAVEFSTGLWARLPEPAQKAAPPVAGALGVRSLQGLSKATGMPRCSRHARDSPEPRRCCCWAP